MTVKKYVVFKTSDAPNTEPEKFNNFSDAMRHVRTEMFINESNLNDELDKVGVVKIIYGNNAAIVGVVSEVEEKVSCCDINPDKCAGMCGEDNG